MALQQQSRYCLYCHKYTRHSRDVFGGGMGCIITILTGGLFLPIWALIALSHHRRPYACAACGGTGNPARMPKQEYERLRAEFYRNKGIPDPREVAKASRPTPREWLEQKIDYIRQETRDAWRQTWEGIGGAYQRLPDWAQPILWGVGIMLPVVGLLLWAFG